jgi:hypothetical protein
MSDIIIRAESLSKLDKIGALKQRHDTLVINLCTASSRSSVDCLSPRVSHYG